MDQKELAAAIGKPQIARLKQISKGLRVGKVLGNRLLVKTVVPYTEMDRVQQEGLIAIPKSVKEANTPLPTTGFVLQVGPDVSCKVCGQGGFDHANELNYCGNYQPSIKEEDMVLFPKFAGTDFTIESEDLRIIDAREVLCTLVDTDESVVQDATSTICEQQLQQPQSRY